MRSKAVVLAALVAAGCATTAQGPAAPQRTAEDYFPLAVGNRWTYEVDFLGEKRQHTVELVGQESGFFVDNEGARLTIDAYGVRDERRYLLQEPVQQDHAWKNTVSVSATERYRIESVGATCETPAGVFKDCVVVSSTLKVDNDNTLINELTFARDVGLVRIATDLSRNGQRTPQHRRELLSFELKGQAQ